MIIVKSLEIGERIYRANMKSDNSEWVWVDFLGEIFHTFGDKLSICQPPSIW